MSRTLCCLSPKDNPIKLRNLIIDYLTSSHSLSLAHKQTNIHFNSRNRCTVHLCAQKHTEIQTQVQRYFIIHKGSTQRHEHTANTHLASPCCPVNVYQCHPPVGINNFTSLFLAQQGRSSTFCSEQRKQNKCTNSLLSLPNRMNVQESLGTLTTVLVPRFTFNESL